MSYILIVAYSVTLTEMHYLFIHPDVDMCEFCTTELSLTLMSHSYTNP